MKAKLNKKKFELVEKSSRRNLKSSRKNISHRTIDTYARSIRRKLKCKTKKTSVNLIINTDFYKNMFLIKL